MKSRFGAAVYGFLGYLLLHVLAVIGLGEGRFPDSASYDVLNLVGKATRLPTVPLVYWIFRDDALRVAFQVVLAAAAWWALASVAAGLARDRRTRIAIRLVLLAAGLAGPVVNWNSLILSESISISLTALAIAAWLRFAKHRDMRSACLVAVAMLFWAFARQPHVLFTALVALLAVGYALVARGAERRLTSGLAVALVLVAAAGLVEIRRNQTISHANVGAIIQQRILGNRGWTLWFERHGMPYSREIAGYAGVPYNYQRHDETYARWVEWVDTRASSLYVRFVLAHPSYMWLKPLPFLTGEQASVHHVTRSPFAGLEPSPTPSLLSPIVNYGRHRDLLPSVVDRLLFDQGEIGDVLAVLLLAGVLGTIAWRRFGPDPRLAVPIVAALLVLPQAYIVWLSGGEAVGELDRLSIVNAVQLRVALWIALAFAVDRLLVSRRDEAA